MNNRTIVIIGGMGPQASLELHKRLLDVSRKHHNGDPDQFPKIIHLSLQIREFISSSSNEQAAIHNINHTLSAIDLSPDALICLPCNTAHKLIDRLQIPKNQFVSMVETVAKNVAESTSQKIGVLASPNTIKSRFYDKLLNSVGREVVTPDSSDLTNLNRLINSVISGDVSVDTRNQLSRIGNSLVQNGADSILLGCTELPIIGIDASVPVFNSLQLLCDELIRQNYCYNGDNHG